MVIFQELGNDRRMVERYRQGLMWGLTDRHPWVRREALRAFRHDRSLASEALEMPLQTGIYPGGFDLCIEAVQHGVDVDRATTQEVLPERSLSALRWALDLDRRSGPKSLSV